MKFKDVQKLAVEKFSSAEFLNSLQEEDPSMLKHMAALKEINRVGYLTLESQAGRKSTGLHYSEKWLYLIEERAYIRGYMMLEDASKFIQQMAYHTDKIVVMLPICCDDVIIPSSTDIPLTTTTRLNTGARSTTTHMSMAVPQSFDTMQRKMINLNKTEKTVMVFCWDPKWNRLADGPHGLFTEVMKILKTL
jgi:hypothetical protein